MQNPSKDSTKTRDFLLLAGLAAICIFGAVFVINKLVEQEETHVSEVKKTRVSGSFGKKIVERDNQTDISVKELCQGHPDETKITLEAFSISNNALRYIGKMERLKTLSLAFTRVDNKGMKYIRGLTTLKDLDLTETKVTDEGLVEVAKIGNLHNLNLAGCNITDEGVVVLKALQQLSELNLSATKITDSSINELSSFSNLRRLSLANTKLTENCLGALSKLPLSRLNLDSTAIGGAEIAKNFTNKELTKLSLQGSSTVDADIPGLSKTVPKVESLVLSNTKITDKGLKYLEGFKALQDIEIRGCPGLTEEGIEKFREAMPGVKVIDQIL